MDVTKLAIADGTVDFMGRPVKYHILDRNAFKGAPQYFISYNEGAPFISDEVPEEFRKPMILHELTEFETHKDKEGRCLESLLAELATIPEKKRYEYILFRTAAFESLLEYLKNHDNRPDFIREVNKSIEYLGGLQ